MANKNGPTAILDGGSWTEKLYGSVTVQTITNHFTNLSEVHTFFRLASDNGLYAWSWEILDGAAPLFGDDFPTESGMIREVRAVYDWALAQAGL